MIRLEQKTLLVSAGLPPALNGSSNIISNLASQFSRDELVLAGEKAPGPPESEWDQDDPDRVKIYFVHRRWPWRFKRTVRLFLFPIILLRVLWVSKKERCKQIVGVFPNEFYLCVAYVASVITGTKFASYFHNTYLDNRGGMRLAFAKWLQPRVFQRSATVFVMSDGMKSVWEDTYANRNLCTLVHTFHEKVDHPTASQDFADDFRIAFMGNLNASNTDAMSRISGVLDHFPNCRMVTYSGVPDESFARIGLTGDQITNTRVGYDQVITELRKFDLLFLPHGFHGGLKEIEYATIFPTRTIPYLLSGTPIIAHSPSTAFLTQWLRRYDAAEIVDEPSVEKICDAIAKLQSDSRRRNEIVSNAFQAAQQFRGSVVADCFRQTLNGAMRN